MKANQKISLSTEKFIPQWSIKKHQEIKQQLQDYWAEDIWLSSENPFNFQDRTKRKTKKSYTGSRLYFENCPSIIKDEIKYACYQKVKEQEWSPTSLHANASKINRICQWLIEKHSSSASLLDKNLEDWLISLKSYLISKNKYFARKIDNSYKTQEGIYFQQDGAIYQFKSIYKFIFDYYDTRNEWDKEIWDLSKLGFDTVNTVRFLNFTELKDTWIYEPSQKFIKYKLPLTTPITGSHKLRAIKEFHSFLSLDYPNISPSEIDREVILNYLAHLKTLNYSQSHHHRQIASLREFFEICFREKWINITGNQIIYNDDLPKYKRNYKPRYIPEEVIKQIIENLPNIGNLVYGRMFLILIECGMRIGELCKISFDCLQQDTRGDYFLKYYQSKFKKHNTIPISLDTVKIIQEQQSYLEQSNCSNSPFLFPSSKIKTQYKAIGASPFCDALKKLIHDHDIKDINGKLWNFTSHQCRHTVGTRMINNDVPQHIVQRFLGHESPTMTQVYAHVHNKTLKKEIAKYHDTRVVNITGEVVESTTPELDNNLDLHLLKKKVLAQSLPNGSCARPIVLGECPHANACLTCGDFRTTLEFLDQHKAQLEETEKLVQNAEEKGWKRHAEMNTKVRDNLQKIITTLESGNKDIVSGGDD